MTLKLKELRENTKMSDKYQSKPSPASGNKLREPIPSSNVDSPIEVNLRPGEWLGRNGEILTLEDRPNANSLDVPDNVKERGMTYQWIRMSTHGDASTSEWAVMNRNGWRAVPPGALNGYFDYLVPEGGNLIEFDGLALMERPEPMSQAAHERNYNVARAQYARTINHVFDDNYGASMPRGIVKWAQAMGDDRHTARSEVVPADWLPKNNRKPVMSM
jgi:hypothetical protein